MKFSIGALYKLIVASGIAAFALFAFAVSVSASTTVNISNLQPSWDSVGGEGVYSAYYGHTSQNDGAVAVSPGQTAMYDGKQAGIIKAGQSNLQWDEGLFGFKPTGTIDTFATSPLSYDVENQTGTNPVWMTIEVGDPVNRDNNLSYQFVPTNQAGWHTVNAATGQWQLMDSNGNATGTPMTLGEVAAANSGQSIVRVYLRLGMGPSYLGTGSGTTAWVDKVTIGDTTYDFVIAPVYVDSTRPDDSGDGLKILTAKKTIPSALNLISAGGTIILNSDITTSAQLDINKTITLDGAGHTIFTTATGGSVINVGANDVTIKNLIENGNGITGNNRGINIYKATNVTLDTVTASNNKKHGVVVNGSSVTVNNITTANNGWGGVDVDLGVGVTSPASLTVNGTSSHTESTAIFIDDITKTVAVVDTNHQYSHKDTGNARAFTLLATGQTAPDETGTATVTDTNKDVIVTSATTPITIELGTVANATINFDSLITGGTGTIPQTTINSSVAAVVIPATTITSDDASWNGTINLPKITTTTVQPTAVTGKTTNVVNSIEVGFNDVHLTFNDPVKLTFAGQAGSSIGWSRSGTFHEITAPCDSATTPTLAADSECKINVGADLVVWTKHFTTFTTYTQTATPAPAPVAVSSGGGGGGFMPVYTGTTNTQQTAAVGQVLGAEVFNFTSPMALGSTGSDVKELQNRLTAEGIYNGPITGYYGALTAKAVKMYQQKNGISALGKVGPATLAKLNSSSGVVLGASTDAQTQEKIATLKSQLQLLLAQLIEQLQTQMKTQGAN